jgi:tripartite-type tricarboxylate transporter receptor subunit TctC
MHDLPYDSFKDFAPVANLIKSEFVLVLHPAVPADNLQDFIALAKSRPGQLNYATAGNGNPNHLAGELFNMMAGVRMQAVPYKGGGPAITDLIGGQVQALFSVLYSVIPQIKAGKLKAIAIARETRLPGLPQVPTFAEAGLPGFDPKSWQGILAPAGTPKAIIDKLAGEIARMIAQREVIEKLGAQGTEPYYLGPEQFAALMNADSARLAKVIKAANIKLD